MSDIISRYHPSELLWKIFSIEHVLLYVEYFTLIVMAISVYLVFVYIIQMYRRSVARAVVLNFFRDYPNEIMSAFGAADLKGEVRRILEQAPPHQDVAHTQVEDNGNEKRSVLAIKINLAAEKKIRRNLHKFNQFSGPIYPSYRLADDDIIVIMFWKS